MDPDAHPALHGRVAVGAGATRGAGRGMAADPDRRAWNQRSTGSAEPVEHYGVTDVDGSRPDLRAFDAAGGTDPAAHR